MHVQYTTMQILNPHSLPWGRVGMQDSPDTAVAMLCGRQLQGQASGQRWARGQRLLLEDELGSEVYLGGAHHDLCSRQQRCLSFVVILQHLGTGYRDLVVEGGGQPSPVASQTKQSNGSVGPLATSWKARHLPWDACL
jgi:hypothetical protein